VLLLMLLVTLPAAVVALDNTLVVYPKIRFSDMEYGSGVPLQKIARVITSDTATAGVGNLPVSLGEIGKRQKVSLTELQKLLAALPALNGFDIVGPQTVLIERRKESEGVEHLLEEAVNSLSQHVMKQWPAQFRNLEFSYVGQQQRLPLDSDSRWLFDLSDLKVLRSRVPVWVEIHNGERVQRVPLWFQVDGDVMVWKAIQPLASKTLSLEFQFIPDWEKLSAVDPADLAVPVEDHRLAVAMKSGEVLTADHLERIPEVDFGADVQVVLYSGNIALITEAKAMRTAYAGERIMFKSKSSEEEFEALVIARNRAQIGSPVHPTNETGE